MASVWSKQPGTAGEVKAGRSEEEGPGGGITAMQQEETAGVVLFVVVKVKRFSDKI